MVGELGEDEVGLGVEVERGQGFSRGVDNAEVGLEEDGTPISSVDVDDREEDRLPDIDIARAIWGLGIDKWERRWPCCLAPTLRTRWAVRLDRLDDPLMSDGCRELPCGGGGGEWRRRRSARRCDTLVYVSWRRGDYTTSSQSEQAGAKFCTRRDEEPARRERG